MKILSAKALGVMIFLAGLALCGAGLWILLSPAQYHAAAKIDLGYVFPDETNRPGIIGDPYYDPYLIVNADTEIRMKVLTNVIAALKLDAGQTARMLSRRVKIISESGSSWIIQVTDENPIEAKQWANAIAAGYFDYGVALAKPKIEAGLRVLQREYTNEEAQILSLRTNGSEKSKLNDLIEIQKLRAEKIKSMRTDKHSSVRIVSLAVVPATPSGPNRILGIVLLVTGLFIAVSGCFCWWRSFPGAL